MRPCRLYYFALQSLIMKKKLLKKGYWAALFSILMIVIGPLVSQTISASVLEVVCTSSGIKLIALDSSDETDNNTSSLSRCDYCKLSLKALQNISHKDGNIFHLNVNNVLLEQETDIPPASIALLTYDKQAPPVSP